MPRTQYGYKYWGDSDNKHVLAHLADHLGHPQAFNALRDMMRECKEEMEFDWQDDRTSIKENRGGFVITLQYRDDGTTDEESFIVSIRRARRNDEIEEDEQYTRFARREAFERWCKRGGWESVEDFQANIGVAWDEIKGKWFNVTGGRCYILDK